VYANGRFDLGHNDSARSNVVVLTGAGSTLNVNGVLYVGCANSYSNQMLITDGAVATSGNGYVGRDNSDNNLMLVSGSGSRWVSTGSEFVIGNDNDWATRWSSPTAAW